MDYTAFSQRYTDSTASCAFADWVGVLGSPNVSNPVLKGLQNTPATVSCFARDVDDALGNTGGATAPWDFVCEPDLTVNWQDIFNAATPYPPPMLADDTSSTTSSSNQPRSPFSDCTLVDSPFQSLPDLASSPAGDALVDRSDRPVASSPASPFDGFKFTFQCHPMAAKTPSDIEYYHYRDYACSQGQYWPGQQLPQHETGTAVVVAPGLTSVMEVNANTFAFTAIDSASPTPPLLSSAELRHDHAVVKDLKPIQTGVQKKRPRTDCGMDSKSSLGESERQEPPRPKRKRKQDTTKRYVCDFPGCDSKHSRSHNLKVHFDSVHLGIRGHVCGEPGCPRTFSRKHDLIRHFQSAHTDLGSPRKSNSKGNKGATARKAIKDQA